MNGGVSKKLRKIVFGDLSRRGTKYITDAKGTLHCTGKRAVYQTAKKNLKKHDQAIRRLNPKYKSGPRWLNPKPKEPAKK